MKKILFVTNDFYPKNIISAVRTTKMVKNVVNQNCDITIITEEFYSEDLRDETLKSDELSMMKIKYVSHSSMFKVIERFRNKILSTKSSTELLFENKLSARDKLLTKSIRIAHFVYSILKAVDWSKQVQKYYANNLSNNSYDVLITTYPRLSSHLFGLWIYKKNKIPNWIADFQDPIYYEVLSSKFISKFYFYLENKIVKKANAITAVTKNLLIHLSLNDNNSGKRFLYLPMSYDEADIIGINKNHEYSKLDIKKINFTYVGGLYGGKRDMSTIFNVIQKMASEKKINLDQIRFNYAGKEFGVLYKQAKRYNCENVLNDIGEVNRSTAIELQKESDIIIINTWNTKNDKGVIPGKLYEAFLVKKPILAVVIGEEKGSELKEMVECSGLGSTFEFINQLESDNKELLKMESFISTIIERKINDNSNNTFYNRNFVESYHYINVTNKLVNLINDL